MSIFNPTKWVAQEIEGIGQESLQKLDNRYINTGENVLDQNISNLNLVHLNMASAGTIYFNTDNTTQTTAYDPNLITSRVNTLLTANNVWTGQNSFTQLTIKDPSSTKTSQIVETDANLNIENNNNGGAILLKLKDGAGTTNSITIDQFRNISGLNDMNSNKVKCSEIRFNSTAYYIKNNGNDDLGIINNITDRSIKLITKTGSSTSELTFDSEGNLTIPSQIQATTLRASAINFTDNLKIYNMVNNFIIDNNSLLSSFKLKNYDINGNAKTLTIDSNLNMTGVNNITLNQLILPNLTQTSSNGIFTVNNATNGGSIIFQNRDDTGIVKQLTIDKNINMTGINDIYAKRLFINNAVLDLTQYDEMLTNTQSIKSSSAYNTSIEYDTGRIIFLPTISSSHTGRNGILKTGDNVILGNNLLSLNGGALTLCTYTSSLTPTGVRMTSTQTELYKPKVMDSLKFADDTTQTTAMTDAYLSAKITSVVNSMNLSNVVPTGTILPYGGSAASPPTGFLGCLGQYVSISTYQNLFDVIGHNFVKGHTTTLPSGKFWLPDLQGAYLKGIGASEIWGTLPMFGTDYVGQSPMSFPGDVQKYNVGKHRHKYVDRGVDSKAVGGGGTVQAVKGSNGTYFTDVETFDENNDPLNEENRPNSIGVCYIIKF